MLHNGFSTLNVMYASCRHNVKRQFIVYFGGCWWVVAYLFLVKKREEKKKGHIQESRNIVKEKYDTFYL